jgi:hypothetical protein
MMMMLMNQYSHLVEYKEIWKLFGYAFLPYSYAMSGEQKLFQRKCQDDFNNILTQFLVHISPFLFERNITLQ